MNQIKLGAILSYVNLFLTNIVGIILTPYTIRMLGNSEYGLYTLAGAFVGYLSILDLGLNNAVTRFVAKYRAEEDKAGERNFLAVVLILYIFISILICIIGSILYFNIDHLFSTSLTALQLTKAKILMLILTLNIAISLPGAAFTGICTGYEKFVFPRILIIIKYLLRSGLLIALLYFGGNSVSLAVLDTIMSLFILFITSYYVLFKLKATIKLVSFNWLFVKEIFAYSIWIFVFALVYQFQWRTGSIVLGINSNTTKVAVYSVGIMLGIYFTLFGNVINGLLLPKAVKSIHAGLSSSELTDQMVRVGRISLILLFYILGAFIVIGKDFIQLWVGKAYKEAWIVAIAIMLGYIVPISQGFGHAILEAKKLVRFKALVFLTCCIIGNIIGAILSYSYGIPGMIAGLFLGLFTLANVMNIYYHKKAGLNILIFFKKAYVPFIVPFICVLVAGIILNYYLGISWKFLLVKISFYSILYFTGIYFFTLNIVEKSVLIKQFTHFKQIS